MKLIVIIFALASTVWGLTSVTAGPAKSQLGHAGLRINWAMDTAAFSVWCFDTISHPSDTDCSSYANKFGSNGTHTVNGMYFSGLLSNTTYFYRIGGSTGSQRTGTIVVSGEDTFTTLPLPSPHPALPTAPTSVDNTFPTCANGRIEVCSGGNPVPVVVGANCDDPTTGLVAKYNAAAWGTVIQIPVTTACNGYYKLTKSAWDGIGRMVVESQNTANLTPGVRVGASNAPDMASMNENFWTHPGSAGGTQSTCYPGGFEWDDNLPSTPGWYMHYCGQSGATGTVSGVTGNSIVGYPMQAVYAVTLSSPVTTVAVGQWGYMTGVGGIPKANGSFQVTAVTSTSSFSVQTYNSYASLTNPTYTSGGTLQLFDWQSVAFTSYSGAAPTGSCTDGTTGSAAWAYSTTDPSGSPLAGNLSSGTYNDPHYSTGRVWRCSNAAWVPHYVVYSQNSPYANGTASTIDITSTTHTWLVGLNFSNPPIFNDPLLYHSGQTLTSGESGFVQGGSAPGYMIFGTSGTTVDVHIDRCLFTRQWPSKSPLFVQLNGTGLTLTNSYMQNLGGNWWGHEDRGTVYDNSAGPMVSCGLLNGGFIDNNYLENYGITVHCDDLGLGGGFNHSTNNITVSRNTFFRNLALIDQAPGSTVNYYRPLRQLLEFKSGVNLDINGNIFSNNFQNVSQGGAIDITPEWLIAGFSGLFCSLSYSGSTGTFTVQSGVSYTMSVGDWIWLSGADPAHMYQVTAVNPGANQFTVGTMATGLSSPLFATILTGDDGVSDVNIRNNTFNNLPQILTNYSHVSHDAQPPRISEDRVAFQNNIINQMGPGTNGSPTSLQLPFSEAWQSSGCGGTLMNVWGGMVDWLLNHNTIYLFNSNTNTSACGGFSSSNQGTLLLFVNNDFPVINVLENEGLVYQNDFEWTTFVTDPISAFSVSGFACAGNGNTVLNCFTAGTAPYFVNHNCSYILHGDPGGYSTPNFWADQSISPAQFDNNLNPLYNAPCISGGAHPASDGLSQGADVSQVYAAQYAVAGARALGIAHGQATISFAPLGAADIANGCGVDWSASSTFATFTRVAGTAGASQNVALTGLPSGLVYTRVNCQTQQPVVPLWIP